MTEAEWLACDDAEAMLKSLSGRDDLRRWRLVGSALFRSPHPWPHLGRPLTFEKWEESRPRVELMEILADDPDSPLSREERDFDILHWYDVTEMLHATTAEERELDGSRRTIQGHRHSW